MKNHICDQQEGDEGSTKFPISLLPGLGTGAWGDMKRKQRHPRGAVLFLVGHVVGQLVLDAPWPTTGGSVGYIAERALVQLRLWMNVA